MKKYPESLLILYVNIYVLLISLDIHIATYGFKYIVKAIVLYYRNGIAINDLSKAVAEEKGVTVERVHNEIKESINISSQSQPLLLYHIIRENQNFYDIASFFTGIIEFLDTYEIETGYKGYAFFAYYKSKKDGNIVNIIEPIKE